MTLENVRQERKQIISEYNSKAFNETFYETTYYQKSEEQHVYVKEIIEETKDTKSFILCPDKEAGTSVLAPFQAGQYLSLKLFINDEFTTRAYSISSSPMDVYDGFYRITVKRVENGLVSNYLLDEVKVNDRLTISYPVGTFCYHAIKDEKNIIGIAGGSGISPFISMAKAILDGMMDVDLTVFYSVKTEEDICFKKEIEAINKKSKNVKFVITLTREEKEGYYFGHINKSMIESAIKDFNSIFMCGPKALYKTMNGILSDFKIPRKNVHFENYFVDFPITKKEVYELKVISRGEEITVPCQSDETLLVALEKAALKAPSLCRVGSCGFCRSILLEGKIKMIGGQLKKAEVEHDYIHPCITYPESDVVLKLDI